MRIEKRVVLFRALFAFSSDEGIFNELSFDTIAHMELNDKIIGSV